MLFIDIRASYPDDLDYTAYRDDQSTLATDVELTPAQQETITFAINSVDEMACQAQECCSTPPMPLAAYLSGNEDRCYLRGFFLTEDGKALCEDCAIEILEKESA